MTVSRLIVAAVVVYSRRCRGVANDDFEPPLNGGKHETCRNERAEADHCQHKGRNPTGRPNVPAGVLPSPHCQGKMPQLPRGIKPGT